MNGRTSHVAGPWAGLSFKLIAVIAFVILLVEVAVFFPSLANFRASWLDDRLRVGGVAVRVFDAVPDVMDLPVEITDPLLAILLGVVIARLQPGREGGQHATRGHMSQAS